MDMLARAMNILDDDPPPSAKQEEEPQKLEKDNYGTEKVKQNISCLSLDLFVFLFLS